MQLLREIEERLSDEHNSRERLPQRGGNSPRTAAGRLGSRHLPESFRSTPGQTPAQISHGSPSTGHKEDENLLMSADIFDQDWGNFEESCNMEHQQHGAVRSRVQDGAPPSLQESRESLFTNQLCDGECVCDLLICLYHINNSTCYYCCSVNLKLCIHTSNPN